MLIFLDYFLFGLFFAPIFILVEIVFADSNPKLESKIADGLLVLFIFFYLNKDLLRGKSLGKRFFGYQVVDLKSGNAASGLQCFFRNLTIGFLWPVEVVCAVINPKRRIGDFLAKTELLDSEQESLVSAWRELMNKFGR
ncbi:RDD family protein [Muricauda sp. 2012CJ35-5]|uniref:RDD family protein n=2 Tax=Flagellimonas spongiicola TaxID=2942208 RepID=A0ABT0PS61_9FLAO|nr:RDD family protein [Allomuricauda spongiicola]